MKKLYTKIVAKKESKGGSIQRPPAATSQLSEDYGLKVIYQGQRPTIDIVAIHGHGGHWKRSWTDQPSGTFWLRDLLPKAVPDARILSYWYDTSNSSTTPIESIAVAFLSELSQLRKTTASNDRPIIFLAHSSGGIFLKASLGEFGESPENQDTKTDFRRIRLLTYGIVFFGVPQHAEDGFDVLSSADAEAGPLPSEPPLMAALRRDLLWLKDSNLKFSRIRADFITTYFTEAPPPITAGQNQEPMIKPESPDILHTNVIRLSKTHGEMIKFPNAADRDFQKVSACVYMMVSEATKDTKI